MPSKKIALISNETPDTTLVEEGLEGLNYDLEVSVCQSEGETIEAIKGVDVIINLQVPMSRTIIDEIDTANAIIVGSHGFNHIDHDAATNNGVMVINSAGFCTEEVSNHTIGFLLACAKSLVQLDKHVREGNWRDAGMPILPPIDGQTFGIVGMGNIGRATARKAQVFGLNVISYDPYLPPWISKEYRVEMVQSLEELASRSDYVSVLVPLNKQTKGLIDKSFFDSMKSSAYFINTCRGQTVDENSLIQTLKQGRIAGAALDVFEQEPPDPNNPLFKLNNVILTPHSAGHSTLSSSASLTRVGQEAARILQDSWPMSLVNHEVRNQIETRLPAKR